MPRILKKLKPKKALPKNFARYFWDTDLRSIDPFKSKEYVIERILEYGDEKAIKWLFKNYKKEELQGVVKQSRGLSRLSANFWGQYFDISKESIRCMSNQLPQRLFPF